MGVTVNSASGGEGDGMDCNCKQDVGVVEKDNWKHRSKGMRCHTCIYYVSKDSGMRIYPEGMEVGRCRRHAPTMNGWPVMRDGDWCGDHKLDENKA